MEPDHKPEDPRVAGWRRRQERIRFEVLQMLHRATHATEGREVSAWSFATSLGVWDEEIWNALVWLQQAGMVRVHAAGPIASITLSGVQYIEQGARRRRTVRGITPPEEDGEP